MFKMIETWLSLLGAFLAGKVLPAAIIIAVGILLIRLVMKIVVRALEKSKLEKAAHSLIKSLLSTVLYLLLGLIAASSLGIDVTGVIALASVLTLAVSLAVQNTLANVIGGFQLLYTHPFHSGDFVEIAGQSGTVQEIGLTYTKLATPDNKAVSIPNSAVTSAQIINYSALGIRRVDISASASYDAPVQKVLDTLREAAAIPQALPDPEVFAGVVKYGDSAIEYVLRFWTSVDDYWPATFAVNASLQDLFAKNGIEMTYPHLNVHLDQ